MNNYKDQNKNAQRLNLLYQERIACLTEMMDEIKEQPQYDLSKVFSIVYKCLNEMELHLNGGGIIGINNERLAFLCYQDIDKLENYWEGLIQDQKQQIINEIVQASKDVHYWNYEQKALPLIKDKPEKIAIAISFLCKHIDDENLYLFVYRNKLKKPLMSDEIQLIKIVSRILGWHLNYEFTYQVLLYQIEKRFRNFIDQ